VGHVETKIFTDNQEKEVTGKLPGVWSILNSKVPWNLPVVHPSSKGQGSKVHENIVENAANHSLFNLFSPANWIDFPRPWGVLLNFILFKESILSSINDPVKRVETQNHCGSHGAYIKSEKLRLCKLIALWQPSASLRFFF